MDIWFRAVVLRVIVGSSIAAAETLGLRYRANLSGAETKSQKNDDRSTAFRSVAELIYGRSGVSLRETP